ncbi:MAG TPA: type VI secretion system tube protein Hcp [Tepidisphaeraceae bacterium]|jgi:type VI secretion system Hcp family effector
MRHSQREGIVSRRDGKRQSKTRARLQGAVAPFAAPPAWMESVESRVMLSASVTYRPQRPDGSLDTPITFETRSDVSGFSPAQVSLLDKGFAAPAYDMFLKLTNIPGESADAKHKDEIDVLAFNWGADALGSTGTGGGGGAGKAQLEELHLVSRVSKASPKLMQAVAAGTHIADALLTVRKSGKDQVEFLKVDLDDAVVSSYQLSTAHDGTLLEEYTLDFRRIDVQYQPTNSDGSPQTPIEVRADGPAQDFAPTDKSLLQTGYAPLASSLDMFLQVDGVQGESQDAKHKDAIDILAYSWGADLTSSAVGGGGAGVGKTTFQEMHFVSRVSQASPKLLEFMATGHHVPSAHLAVVRSGKSQNEFFDIDLQDVLVSSYQLRTSASGQLIEEYTLSFNKADVEYTPQDAQGAPGTPVRFQGEDLLTSAFEPQQTSLLETGNTFDGALSSFLTMTNIPGESHDAKHKDAIDVLAFGWGGDALFSTGGGGAGTGKSTFQELHVVSRLSKASPLILKALNSGQHIQQAVLNVRSSGKDQTDFFTINLDDALIGSYRVTTAADGTFLEEYTLDFRQSELDYRPQNPDGTVGSPVAFQERDLDVDAFAPTEPSLLQEDFALPAGQSLFLTLDGIPGESQDAKHKDAITVLSYGWGGDQSAGATGGGGGAGVGKTTFQEMHFVAPVSKASPKLMGALTSGKHIANAHFAAVMAGISPLEYLTIDLQDVLVSSYQLIHGSHGQMLEEFTLNFAKSSVEYTPQSSDGTPGTSVSFEEQNTAVGDFKPAQRPLLGSNVEDSATLDAFLQISGVQGESQDAKHKGAIDVKYFSWGADAAQGAAGGGGAGVGKSTLQELHVVSRVSKASPSILNMLDDGRHAPDASLIVRRSGKDQVDFYTLDLTDVLVSSYQVTTAQDGTLLEEYTLTFRESDLTYLPQNSDGSAGAPVEFRESQLDFDDFAPEQTSVLQDGFVNPAAPNLFLQIDGIPGESQDAKHKDQIDLLAFSWGADATGNDSNGGGAGVGKTQFQELHFVTRVSQASPRIIDRLLTGQRIPGAIFSVINPTKGQEFFRINLADVTVGSYQVSTAHDGTLIEEFTLAFGPGGTSSLPVADAGGPYSVGDGQTVTLDASATTDAGQDPATLTYQWDLDGDGIFGETGVDAARGDETGIHPVLSLASLFGPRTLDVALRVTDSDGHTSTASTTVTIVDITPPDTTILTGPAALSNQTSASFTFTGTDQGTPAGQMAFSAELDGGARFAVTSPLALNGLADGVHTLKLFAKDLAGNEDPTPAVYTWKVDTIGPAATNLLANPNPASVGTPITLTASISDLLTGASNVTGAQYSLDGVTWLTMSATDGAFDSSTESVKATIAPLHAGVYTIYVRGSDAAGNTGPASTLTLPVYDRNAGFVTGGGFIDSPAGAEPAHPRRSRKAFLVIDAAYPKRGNEPIGLVVFSVDGMNFVSTDLDWLVVTGNQARLAGSGRINGHGHYGFEISMIDGHLGKGSGNDRFRIRIVDQSTGDVVYDNGLGAPMSAPPTTPVLGGNIKIHAKDDR